MMGFVQDWFDNGQVGTVVKQDFPTQYSYVVCRVRKVTSANWSYTFTIVTKDGPGDSEVVQGTYTFSRQTQALKATTFARIEAKYNEELQRLEGADIEFEEAEPINQQEVVQEQEVYGSTVKMIRVSNAVGLADTDGDRIYYLVFRIRPDGSEGAKTTVQTQEEAEERFEYLVRLSSTPTDMGLRESYRGVEIQLSRMTYADGSEVENTNSYAILTGAVSDEFQVGNMVSLTDPYGTLDFGTLTGDEDADMTLLKSFIDAKLDPREDPLPDAEPGLEPGPVPVRSWGWYDANPDADDNPFSLVRLENVYTVSGTDGRILVLDDDDFIAQGFNSGLAKLVVKPGYRVQLKVMLQQKGYLGDYLPGHTNYSFETYGEPDETNDLTNYVDTEKVKIDLFGGDVLEINIDGLETDPGYDNFKITQNGELITRGGAPTINNETFLAVIQVERLEVNDPRNDAPATGQVGTVSGNMVALVVGGVLILAVLYMVLSRGGEE